MRRVRRADDGSVLVESAFVLPVVLLLVFAIIEFGLLFSTTSTSRASTRAGARFASANFATASSKTTAADEIRDEVAGDLSALVELATPQTLWIYRVDPVSTEGEPIGGAGFTSCNTDCFQYSWNGSTFTYASGSWLVPDACGTTLDSIGVTVLVDHALVTGFFSGNRNIREHTTLRLEPLPLQNCG